MYKNRPIIIFLFIFFFLGDVGKKKVSFTILGNLFNLYYAYLRTRYAGIKAVLFLFFLLIPYIIFPHLLLSLLPTRNSNPGSLSRLFFPLPATVYSYK